MHIRSWLKPIFFILSFLIFLAYAGRQASSSETPDPKALFEKRCSRCHSIDKTNKTESAEYWKTTVAKMKKKFFSGISDEEATIIADYLIKTKVAPLPASGQENKETLPAK
jgi:hypothetical protein